MISAKLDPNILPKQVGGLKAERTFHRITFTPDTAKPGETLRVGVPKLTENLVLVPGTLALRFDLKIQPSTTDERYAVNNVGRNLVQRMVVKFSGETIQTIDLSRYDLYTTYRDLWMTEFEKSTKIEQGIGSVKLRKVRSPTKTAPASADAENSIKAAYGTKYIIPLDFEVVNNHGIFYPRQLAELMFEVTLADASNILQLDGNTALSGAQTYDITNLELQYETIYSDIMASSASSEYMSGKAFLYDHVHLYRTYNFLDKTDELITETINVPRRSLKGLLLLFVKPFAAGLRDSESFHNPGITKIGVNVNGVPNKIYSHGMLPVDVYNEVVRRYAPALDNPKSPLVPTVEPQISPGEFFQGNKYAVWIDLRTSNDDNIHGQGLRLVNTQDGVTLEIRRTKNASASDADRINWYIFVVSDAQLSIEGGQVKSVAY